MFRTKQYNYFLFLVLLLFSLILYACQQVSIEYIGDEFKPTEHIDVYYTLQGIKNRYKVIGIAMVSETENVFSQEVLARIVKKAKEVGADAIAINIHSLPEAFYNPAEYDTYINGVGNPVSSWGGETYYVHQRTEHYILKISVTFLRLRHQIY